MSALERDAEVPTPTPHKMFTPASTGEESREAPEHLAWGLAFPEATSLDFTSILTAILAPPCFYPLNISPYYH